MFTSKEDKYQKMPPYRPYERPENGRVRDVVLQKPIKLKFKRDYIEDEED